MGAIAAVAVIAVFAAVRKDQVKQNELGTPTEVYTDDGSSLATPMTHRLDGKYCHGSYGRRTTDLVDASDNTPLASIVVIGPDDDFHTPNGFTSTHRYRSYDGTEQRTRSTKANSNYHENAVIPAQQQLGTIEDPIFDSLDTQVSFSSSSDPPSYEFEDNLPDSYFMVSATYSEGSDLGSDVSTAPRQHQTPSISGDEDSSNATGSFASSLESENYDVRDTEASEHIYESELCTNSSRVAMSFDMGSV
ncbi:Hypothetical protein PHPALM_37681 [Phytophthora palmivora]|uniref:Uncharacterized protein n=1 Tax=Phytophthora palmivora TaxID=4796 RepID=A0A2P4WWS9_9STRA|nr:Hypothetical protein PHPALM_37681 [Phytophthora palmivora]